MVLHVWTLFSRLCALGSARRPERRTSPRRADPPVPPNAIVVDGSNVMHWGGDPSALVLGRVVKELQNKGYAPVVIFDASVGYRLGNSYMGPPQLATLMSVPQDHIYVVGKGVVADEVILDFAREHRLRVVTNDRYRDWASQFTKVTERGFLIRGTWREGTVIWNNPADLRAEVPA
jgi:hypothetical protein